MNGAWQPPAGSTKAGGCFGSLLNRRTLGLPTDALAGSRCFCGRSKNDSILMGKNLVPIVAGHGNKSNSCPVGGLYRERSWCGNSD